ncbi:MAG: hypothetical protein AAGJ96_01605 [Pseudomonadota bacterium]
MTTPGHILWHLGPQKTGSTSLQALLLANRGLLRPHCLVFPKREGTKRARFAAHDWYGGGDVAPLRTALRDLTAKLAPADAATMIVSDETLLGFELAGTEDHALTRAARLIPELIAASSPHRASIILFTRARGPWLRSAYNQAVRQMRETRSFEAWHAEVALPPDWPAWESALRPLAPDLHFIALEDDPQPGLALLRLAGVPDDVRAALAPATARNESLPPGAIAFLREMNASPLNGRALAEVRARVVAQPHLFASEPV